MELRDFLNIVRARKWVIIQAVVVVTLVVVVTTATQPVAYRGEAKVLITDRDVAAAIFGSAFSDLTGTTERSSETQVEIMKSIPVAELAARSLDFPVTPDGLLGQVAVEAIGQTNVITVTATDVDARRAAAIANAMAEAYVQWTKEANRESINAAAKEVQSRLEAAQSEILTLGKKIQTSGRSAELDAQLSIANAKYASLAQKLEELRVNEQLEVGSGRVMGVAVPEGTPVSPKPVRNGVLGLAAGLVFGLSLAFLLEYMDNTVKSVEEAESLYGAPVLGDIPAEKLGKGEKRRLSIVLRPGGAAAEAYRVLRSNLNFVNFQRDIKTLLITSSAPGEGKSSVSANLAAALARAGARVVLLNADFHRPVTDELFSVNNFIGLSDILLGSVGLDAAIQRPVAEGPLVINSGKTPPNPSELLGSDRMGQVIKELDQSSDWVVIDSPPLLAASDAVALARWVDGVLLITRSGVSTRQSARAGREMLDRVGARVVGVVVWGVKPSSRGDGRDHYGYYGSNASDDHASEPVDST